MANDNVKTPSDIAADARQRGQDAAQAMHWQAAEALDTAKGVAADARDIARDASTTGKVYARDAVDAAGRKLGLWQDKVAAAQEGCTRYIAQEPVKSTLIAIASGALLTGLLMSAVRGRRS